MGQERSRRHMLCVWCLGACAYVSGHVYIWTGQDMSWACYLALLLVRTEVSDLKQGPVPMCHLTYAGACEVGRRRVSWNPSASDGGKCGAVDSVISEELWALG